MKLPQCDREQEVVDALRSGRWRGAWGEEIRQHAANCAVCAEVALAAELFQCEADRARNELGPPGAGLPSAGLVWWKAQLAARREAERRAAAPVEFVAHLAYAVGAVAAVLLGVRHWPRLAQWLHRAPASTLIPHWAAAPQPATTDGGFHWFAHAWSGQTPIFLLAASAAMLAIILIAACLAWRED